MRRQRGARQAPSDASDSNVRTLGDGQHYVPHDMSQSKRIFIAFAVEDKAFCDLLRGQSKLGNCPIVYTDLSVKQPWDSAWKPRCRERIRGCDGVIALLSRNVRTAAGARWEIKCAIAEGVPVLGVYISRTDL